MGGIGRGKPQFVEVINNSPHTLIREFISLIIETLIRSIFIIQVEDDKKPPHEKKYLLVIYMNRKNAKVISMSIIK